MPVRQSRPVVARLVSLSRLLAVTLLVVGCAGTPGASNFPATPPGSTFSAPSTASPSVPAATTPGNSGFAFSAGAVLTYYQGLGFVCDPARASTAAAGFSFQSCQRTDEAGRTRVIALSTDRAGQLAEGYAVVWGKADEAVLEPALALEPLAGFLGALFGPQQGAGATTWLAEHLGAAYAQTEFGPLRLATYNGTGDDPSVLYVEAANQAYLAAPAP